jgi:hypothetical protein
MIANKLLLVKPCNFYSNKATALDNYFQKTIQLDGIQKKAIGEFHNLLQQLESCGIANIVFNEDPNFSTPDAIFPNNWFSTMPNNKAFLFPMKHENRRAERQVPIVNFLKKNYTGFIDLTGYEHEGQFLEGTGSMVANHNSKKIYLSRSQRSSESLAQIFCNINGYELISFQSAIRNQIIYHTNVMMFIASPLAAICIEAIVDKNVQSKIIASIEEDRQELLQLSIEQLFNFCGNCLQVKNQKEIPFLIMSTTAYRSFTKQQLNAIEKHMEILMVNIENIEHAGGGGVRCMLAELY